VCLAIGDDSNKLKYENEVPIEILSGVAKTMPPQQLIRLFVYVRGGFIKKSYWPVLEFSLETALFSNTLQNLFKPLHLFFWKQKPVA